MSEYPIEKQVIPLRDAKKLHEILRNDAPGSVWAWQAEHKPEGLRWYLRLTTDAKRNKMIWKNAPHYSAYTGDELGVLLLNSLPGGWFGKNAMPPLVSGRARTAIDGLERGFITKEDFKYV